MLSTVVGAQGSASGEGHRVLPLGTVTALGRIRFLWLVRDVDDVRPGSLRPDHRACERQLYQLGLAGLPMSQRPSR